MSREAAEESTGTPKTQHDQNIFEQQPASFDTQLLEQLTRTIDLLAQQIQTNNSN